MLYDTNNNDNSNNKKKGQTMVNREKGVRKIEGEVKDDITHPMKAWWLKWGFHRSIVGHKGPAKIEEQTLHGSHQTNCVVGGGVLSDSWKLQK